MIDCLARILLLKGCCELAERLAGYSAAFERLDLMSDFHALYLQVEHACKECDAACRELHEHRRTWMLTTASELSWRNS